MHLAHKSWNERKCMTMTTITHISIKRLQTRYNAMSIMHNPTCQDITFAAICVKSNIQRFGPDNFPRPCQMHNPSESLFMSCMKFAQNELHQSDTTDTPNTCTKTLTGKRYNTILTGAATYVIHAMFTYHHIPAATKTLVHKSRKAAFKQMMRSIHEELSKNYKCAVALRPCMLQWVGCTNGVHVMHHTNYCAHMLLFEHTMAIRKPDHRGNAFYNCIQHAFVTVPKMHIRRKRSVHFRTKRIHNFEPNGCTLNAFASTHTKRPTPKPTEVTFALTHRDNHDT